MENYIEDRNEKGFTLIELLIAIVVVGILTAVAIVGIAGLTNNGKTSACKSSLDAAKAATAVHYANTNGTLPARSSRTSRTTPNAEWEAPAGATIDGDHADGTHTIASQRLDADDDHGAPRSGRSDVRLHRDSTVRTRGGSPSRGRRFGMARAKQER